jgi:osmotically inducible protein OsmC
MNKNNKRRQNVISRNGSAEWLGDIKNGSGTVTVGNGVFQGAYSYGSRFGEEEGTNPEQLIAAAQAACFTMALANLLATAGHAPESVRTNARVQLRIVNGAPMLTRLDLDTEGLVRASMSSSSNATQTRPRRPVRWREHWLGSPRWF